MAVKVSVVVPVYNPGPYLEPCLESLLGQSLPPESLELIFVDDGSTDQTPERLRQLASTHSHVRVIGIPNSGWPGKPRNVGTDAAQGEYVMYVDQDDALEPQSLERMYALGSANDADVVLGKVISDFRGVHHNLYRESRSRCDVFSGNLMYSLTPHKMLRTEFLRQHNIRYPEGPRRLEDQLFMTKAYFAARTATIVANYVCYRYQRRSDGRNAGSKRIDPPSYYRNLREVLDVVDGGTVPGEQRDFLYGRFLRTEMLGRLGGPNVAKAPPDYLTSLHREVRTLLDERFPVSVDHSLGAALRGHAALIRFGTLAEIAQHAKAVDGITATARLTGLHHLGGKAAAIDVEARMLLDGRPLMLQRGANGWLLPPSFGGGVLGDTNRLVESAVEMLGDVIIQHRDLKDEWFVPGQLRARIDEHGDQAEVVWSGTATVDPLTAAGGEPLRHGLHDFFVRVQAFGVTRSKRLGNDRGANVSPLPLLIDRSGRINHVYDTDLANLSLNADARDHWLVGALRSAPFVDAPGGQVAIDLGVCWAQPPESATLTLTPLGGGPPVRWPLRPTSKNSPRWAAPASLDRLLMRPGRYRAHLTFSAKPEEVTMVQEFVLDNSRRRVWLQQAARLGQGRLKQQTRRVLARVLPPS